MHLRILALVLIGSLILVPNIAMSAKSWQQLNQLNQLFNDKNEMVDLKILIPKVAALEGITPVQLAVIVLLESGANPNPCVTGRDGEEGITQVMPSTRKEVAEHLDTYKPVDSLIVAAKFFKSLEPRAKNELEIFAAYNGGSRVFYHGMRPSTKHYIKKADRYLKKAKEIGWEKLFFNTIVRNTDRYICNDLN